jgi:hypothetical protein
MSDLTVERESDNALPRLSTVRLPSPELLSTSGRPEVERETDNALLSRSTAGPVWHRRPNTRVHHVCAPHPCSRSPRVITCAY